MPRTCTVCNHKDRQAIEESLLTGDPFRNIAERFTLSSTAIFRHKSDHLLQSVRRSHEAGEVLHADSLVDHVKQMRRRSEDLYAEVESILAQARRSCDLRAALDAIRTAGNVLREGRGNLRLLAELTGELQNVAGPVMIVLPFLDSDAVQQESYPMIDIAMPKR